MGASLGVGSTSSVGQCKLGDALFAAKLPFRNDRLARTWRPATVGPYQVLFTGCIDNAADVASELGVPVPRHGDNVALSALYGQALIRWGDAVDHRLLGEYAVTALNQRDRVLRLARSPLRAPPLHYHVVAERVLASTIPRPIFAAGVENYLDDSQLADIAWFNTTNESRSCFVGVDRVPLGTQIFITPQRVVSRRYYDIRSLAPVPKDSRASLVSQAHALLAEGTRAALAGSSRPAIMLSGGLDSPLVALKTLDVLPPEQSLPVFTRVPEADAALPHIAGLFSDERPLVQQFCAMHPRLVPHFDDAKGMPFDEMAQEMFHATGTLFHGLGNVAAYHRMWKSAREAGCDRILHGEFGNMTVSAEGNWGYAEYLVRGRWIQLFRALKSMGDDRSLLRRLIAMAILPWLPDAAWRKQRSLRGRLNVYTEASPLRRDHALESGAIARAEAAGAANPRQPQRDRFADMMMLQDGAWGGFSYAYHGFEQIHGIEQRDPTAYRPFFEFCAGLPTDMFLFDGTPRWLAREMLKGRMPEAQRTTRQFGRHHADWHHKMARQRSDMLLELRKLACIPRIAKMFDVEGAIARLEDWPDTADLPDARRIPLEGAVSRVLLMSRFINYVEGRNLS